MALDVGTDKFELFAALDPSMYARRIGQLYGSISVRYSPPAPVAFTAPCLVEPIHSP